jgi:hypothetical protein
MVRKEQAARLWTGMVPQLDEKQRRLYAGTIADTYGYGGIKIIREVTGMSENTIRAARPLDRDTSAGLAAGQNM